MKDCHHLVEVSLKLFWLEFHSYIKQYCTVSHSYSQHTYLVNSGLVLAIKLTQFHINESFKVLYKYWIY